jgi:flavin-dependent dehydrogenase
MDACDVLIVGGGPAGSTCAGKLRQAGLEVLLLDKQVYPRDKPCAGWITPQVLDLLAIDREEYCRGRVLQAVSSFRTGLIYGPEMVTRYGTTVSYGIRRSEFDHFLLQRSGVRHKLGTPVTSLESRDGGWLVNGHIRTRLVVGAGGHFCPVAHQLGARIALEEAIVAQVTESAMTRNQERSCRILADTPELFFCRDLKGYGWVFRKGGFINIGLGRMDRKSLGRHTRDFCRFLEQRGDLPAGAFDRFRGHAYLSYRRQGGRRIVADGALLVGDAAGLSFPQSGEGILPAIESARLAAETIIGANGDYRRDNLESYPAGLAGRFGGGGEIPSSPLVSALLRSVGARLLSSRWFTRHVVLDRWFLHT